MPYKSSNPSNCTKNSKEDIIERFRSACNETAGPIVIKIGLTADFGQISQLPTARNF